MRALWAPCCAIVLAAALGSAPTEAWAKPPTRAQKAANDARARKLYLKGDAAYAEGRYEDALANFEEAYELSERKLLLFNIGNTLERLGRLEEAADKLQQYLPHSKKSEKKTLDKRIENLNKRVEEEQQAAAEKKKALAKERAKKRERERRAKKKKEPAPPPEREVPTLSYVLLGAGGAAIATGGVLGLMALSARSEADEGCQEANGDRLCTDAARDSIDRDKSLSLWADVGFGVGLVAVGVGAYLYLDAKSSGQEPAQSARVGVRPRAGGGELEVVGHF